jgi:hypothetical protein
VKLHPMDPRSLDTKTMTQSQIAEKDAEIERWKVQHEEMLLKHAREQHIALSTLDGALKEIERLKALLTRAADALEGWIGDLPASHKHLIQALRKAAQ